MSDTAAAWDRGASAYQASANLPTDVAHYGPDLPTEADLRLLGDLKGKRVLELGCGAAQCSIAFAKQGATAIGVDFSAAQLALARELSDREEVKVELRHGDMADLAFLRADSIDLVFSAFAFGYVEDLNRVFRQVHRVLKVGAPLVFSLPHPAYHMLDEGSSTDTGRLVVRRSYFDRRPVTSKWGGVSATTYHHTFSDLYMGLARSSYRVDLVLEPEPAAGAPRSPWWRESMEYVPPALIVRARKEGN
ncbi:MAG TPA: class I SAM-dependent methyltransferase [Acidimicrobiales bacterium]|nr:class I SAM-dependent methyltransferase [Acidimicrobiales bacterium]